MRIFGGINEDIFGDLNFVRKTSRFQIKLLKVRFEAPVAPQSATEVTSELRFEMYGSNYFLCFHGSMLVWDVLTFFGQWK